MCSRKGANLHAAGGQTVASIPLTQILRDKEEGVGTTFATSATALRNNWECGLLDRERGTKTAPLLPVPLYFSFFFLPISHLYRSSRGKEGGARVFGRSPLDPENTIGERGKVGGGCSSSLSFRNNKPGKEDNGNSTFFPFCLSCQ